MRVNIHHSERTKGLIGKTTWYDVTCSVTFSAEELAIIKQRDIKDKIVMERGVPDGYIGDDIDLANAADRNRLSVETLMGKKPDVASFRDIVTAKQYDADLKQALTDLKQYMEMSTDAPKSSSFEL